MRNLKDVIASKEIARFEVEGKKVPENVIVAFNGYIDQIAESFKDYNSKIVEEVCEKIRKFAYDTFKEFGCFDETDLEHILDKIKGEK